jgi:tungstate transport system substrate-binding protein
MGKGLKIAETGDSDMIFVHSRPIENAFVVAGYGVNRRDFMYNEFIIIRASRGPRKHSGHQ